MKKQFVIDEELNENTFLLKKPKKPQKPQIPEKTQKYIKKTLIYTEIDSYGYNTKSVADILKLLNETIKNIPLDEIYFSIETDKYEPEYHALYLSFETKKEIPEKEYQYKFKMYKKDLKTYNKKIEIYKGELKEWQDKYVKYLKTLASKIQKIQEKNDD